MIDRGGSLGLSLSLSYAAFTSLGALWGFNKLSHYWIPIANPSVPEAFRTDFPRLVVASNCWDLRNVHLNVIRCQSRIFPSLSLHWLRVSTQELNQVASLISTDPKLCFSPILLKHRARRCKQMQIFHPTFIKTNPKAPRSASKNNTKPEASGSRSCLVSNISLSRDREQFDPTFETHANPIGHSVSQLSKQAVDPKL